LKELLVRPAAIADIESAFLWYERQRFGLGDEFRYELEATFQRVTTSPLLYAPVHRDTRRALLRRFPYGVFYRDYTAVIVVVAVMHVRRAPQRWRVRS
jgi:plasmid stabilization system protein ParE